MTRSERRRQASPSARLLIVDDHPLVRAGLRSVLADEPGLEVAGEAASGREAVELCGRLRPHLVLLDARMPDLDGLAATRAIKQAAPETHVILITVYESRVYVEEALKAGASGYVLKGTSKQDIIQAVRQTLRGATVLPSDLAHDRLRRVAGETGGEAAKL
jgi:DNA-binding NarL/FixJ family response regulator